MQKILAFSSIRSDYDLMSPLYALLDKDPEVDFKIIVSGAHLSQAHGFSVKQIREDGFDILLEIETLLSSDTALSRVKSASLLLQNCLETIAKFSPDLLLYAGDREDVLIYGMISGYLGIPSVHFSAGDHVTDGYIDNPIRHATSKLSTAHFVTLLEHKKRLMRMGEDPARIFVTGNIALDRFVSFEPMPIEDIKSALGVSGTLEDYALLIFHPVTKEMDHVDEYFENILKNLEVRGIRAFVSYPNVDPGNQKLIKCIEKYAQNPNFIFYKNLDRELFLSIYKHAKFIIGNSSSGVCEAASLKIPAINVGLRQTGRYADENVIFCGTNFNEISDSIDKALSDSFQENLKTITNSYGSGNSAQIAYECVKTVDFKSMIGKVEDPLSVELMK